jgi:uridine kinase
MQGRAPWYDESGVVKKPLIIGVAGGSCSGKNIFCEEIRKKIHSNWIIFVSESSFYRDPPEDESLKDYNWDHPHAFDFDLFVETIRSLQQGLRVEIAGNKKLPRSQQKKEAIYGGDVVIIVGTLILYDARLRGLLDFAIFVETDADVCLIRRIRRDCFKRGLNYLKVLRDYERFVKPGFNSYILPTKNYAQVIVPFNSESFSENDVAVTLLSQFITNKLSERDKCELVLPRDLPSWSQIPPNVILIPQSFQIRSILTILRNSKTSMDDFIFHTDRLTRLLIEHTLASTLSQERVVTTPTGCLYHGMSLDYGNICAVSVMRAGEALENAAREVIKDIKIGKMLIQSVNKAPRLFYCNLKSILSPNCQVLLFDATLATGSTIRMAVRILLDHGVRQENIFFVNLISSPQGIHYLLQTYAHIKIFTAAIDETLDDNYYISPGIGNFGDRYFGTT